MLKTRTIPLAAATALLLAVLIYPLTALKASASSLAIAKIFEDAQTSGSIYKAALMDADFYSSENGVLTKSEETELLSLLQETAEEIECNVGVVITHDLKGMDPERYNANFSTAVFGSYTDSATLLLLNRHGNQNYISRGYTDDLFFSDRADTLFSENSQRIFDRIYKALDRDEDDFTGACTNFCKALKTYSSSTGRLFSSIRIDGSSVFAALIFGTIVSCFVVSINVKGYKKKTPVSASHYIDKGRTRINRQEDLFIREYTTSVRISSSSSGGHSGGSRGGGHSSGHHSSHHSGRGR